MKKIVLIFILSCSSLSFGQEKVFYKEIVETCIKELNKKSMDAFIIEKNNELGRKLFDSLVNTCIKGKYLSEYNFKTYRRKTIKTEEISKPILLLTSANWCAPCWGEIPTLNTLIEKYEDKIEIIVLFWNQKKDLKKMASKYDSRIHLVPSKVKQEDKSTIKISGFNHQLDFPTAYLINENKEIIDLTRGAAFPNKTMTVKEANKFNEEKLTKFLKPVILP